MEQENQSISSKVLLPQFLVALFRFHARYGKMPKTVFLGGSAYALLRRYIACFHELEVIEHAACPSMGYAFVRVANSQSTSIPLLVLGEGVAKSVPRGTLEVMDGLQPLSSQDAERLLEDVGFERRSGA